MPKPNNNNNNKTPPRPQNTNNNKEDASEKKKEDSVIMDEDFDTSSDDSSSESEDEMVSVKMSNKMVALEYRLEGHSEVPLYLFYKQHNGAIPNNKKDENDKNHKNERTKGHVLFCTNPSPFLNEEGLSELFSSNFDSQVGQCVMSHLEEKHGHVENWLEFQNPFSMYRDHPRIKSGTAHILLNKASAVQKALEKPIISAKVQAKPESKCGLEKYLEEYQTIQFPSDKSERDEAKKELNQYMKEFDIKEKERIQVINVLRNKADDKGWTKVFHRGNSGPIHASELKPKKKMKKVPQKMKHKLDLPFYKFQKVEKKKKAFEDLREQFERDQALIERMKREKKFETVSKANDSNI
ncbi:hypothetical protein FDP41_005501 [Naegleria fowleri]|uniref:Ribosomal RNA-processing protein 7 C-terminal domain-containing protein n=2 Tax=Naegleria fowleri TaxID=5763 RepID=A0A6A5BEP7_NAEFO|nr:uncharacterized protein FDP41_005501 [Naegleria fowleri]KAF0975507.1 hypothetical protein FDP41_005501 [Naegleria fowleri]